MNDGGTDLALNIVADHRKVRLFEAILPVRFTCDKDRNTVHKANTCLENLLDIPLRSGFRADRQVVYYDIGAGIFENFYNIVGLPGSFGNDACEGFAPPIMGHTAINL